MCISQVVVCKGVAKSQRILEVEQKCNFNFSLVALMSRKNFSVGVLKNLLLRPISASSDITKGRFKMFL